MAGRLLRLVPDGVLNRILPHRYRYDPAELHVAVPPSTPIRLFIAPVNWAGQAWRWARAAEQNIDGVGAVTMAYRVGGEFGHPADLVIPATGYVLSSGWQRRQRDAVLTGFTHVIIEAERHIFGRVYDQTVEQQVRELLGAGVRAAFLCHGSDIRLPSRHAAGNEYSPFLGALGDLTARLEKQALENKALLDTLRLPVFVSTLGLLSDVPEASWLPVVVDPSLWATESVPFTRERPVVAHAPSRASMKGSELIDPVMRRLHDDGLIEYVRIEGVPAGEMPAVYRHADVVLDQFRLGDYGVAACEALAAGRVVVGHVTTDVRARVKAETGRDLPIVEATAATLERIISDMCENRERYRTIARSGVEFVQGVHDGRRSADVLRPFLTNPEEDSP
ncbi:glycosyltransferase [Cryobacterium tagatosivorans]|uniref:Glycosyltransferase family 1 protein n=1 Tax=Cryobacterium tagatosivorans TaxID=1259199 RepID=A0A4R8UG62_9MICO|nr:glycosyltransferase family 1 protein [Cryobacterium tagatosivorans]TFB53934.1 glycosyltransferase family 1 protein [Cryobacterium tagatosivorans]